MCCSSCHRRRPAERVPQVLCNLVLLRALFKLRATPHDLCEPVSCSKSCLHSYSPSAGQTRPPGPHLVRISQPGPSRAVGARHGAASAWGSCSQQPGEAGGEPRNRGQGSGANPCLRRAAGCQTAPTCRGNLWEVPTGPSVTCRHTARRARPPAALICSPSLGPPLHFAVTRVQWPWLL